MQAYLNDPEVKNRMMRLIHGYATQVMLPARFHATVDQKPYGNQGDQQQLWSSETHVQPVDQTDTRKTVIPAMGNRIINVKRAAAN